MNETDRFAAALRFFGQMIFGTVWFLLLSNKLDKIIKLLEAAR